MNVRCVGALACLAGLVSFAAESGAAYPFFDDFESGLGSWTTNGAWGLTTATAVSPTRSATDTPGALYGNNSDSALAMASAMNLGAAVRPVLAFQHRHAIEAGYDDARVEVSIDGGGAWSNLASHTGNRVAWTRDQIDLSAFAGQADVRIRFRLVTDGSVIMDGWYLDDVRVDEAPAAVSMTATSTAPNAVALTWVASADPRFARYRILRSLTPAVDWKTATVVADIASVATTSAVDIAVSPKTSYHYAVMVLTTNGLHSVGPVASAATPPGMDYPFLDNAEGGGNTWIPDARWAISNEVALSGTHAWSDSPYGNYSNSMNASLTLSAPLDLRTRRLPVWMFAHRYVLPAGDVALAEVSTNAGASWAVLKQFTSGTVTNWTRERLSLAPYTNAVATLIRFRLTTDASGTADGWHLDDISVADSPDPVDVFLPSEVSSHTLRVSWSQNTNALFSHYVVVGGTNAGQTLNSRVLATVSDPATTSMVVSNLALDTVHYFRVYAVSLYGSYSPDGGENSARTLNHPIPFADDFEGSLVGWNFTGTWGASTNDPHGGGACLSDSPLTAYPNSSDTWAVTAVNLLGSTWPVLTFWDRYSIATPDWGWVEVSANGTAWTRVYSVNGAQADWREKRVDLSPWRQQTNLRIRFRLSTDGSTTADGWAIDDVSVGEHAPLAFGLPFTERFDAGLTNWIASRWTATTNGTRDAPFAAVDSEGITMSPDAQQSLTLGGPLDLSGTTNPQLTFWVRGDLSYRSYFRAQVSTDNGVTWPDVHAISYYYSAGAVWQRVQVSLSAYRVANVRLRFLTWTAEGTQPAQDIFVDKITVEDMPAPVVLQTAVPGLKTIDLTWTPSALPDFATNLVYRSVDATVDLNDTRIGAFTDPNVTNLTDTGRSIGATYWYRVYTVNTNDTYTPSNDRSTTTVPIGFPFADGMESLANWDATGSWGASSNSPHGGGACLADSPVGDYNNSSDSYILTAVNLLGSTWPVLTFWDRYSIATPDWGWVEVSANGTAWTRVYSVNGAQADWREKRVDLSPWRQQTNLRIRFRLSTDGSMTADGWAIDDVNVGEHAPLAFGLPFTERFDAGLTNWIASRWTATTNGTKDAPMAAVDSEGITMSPDAQQSLTLGGPLDLSGTTNPQLTFWVRGDLSYRSYFRAQVSTDNGVNWPDVHAINYYYSAGAVWQRVQVSLSGYRVANVRLRFQTSTVEGTQPAVDFLVDKITVEDMPAPVILSPPDQIDIHSMRLTWSVSSNEGFAAYRVYRSTATGVSDGSEQIAWVTNAADNSLVVGGLQARRAYYYRVYVENTNDTRVGSGEASARTLGVSIPWSDTFETNQPGWTFTGTWGALAGAGQGGGVALADSPGDYVNSSDSHALMAVSLVGTTWPVFRFTERVSIAENDWGYVEVSSNDGANWTRIYGTYGSRTNWTERVLDLSPWKNQSAVWIRFRLMTDGGTTADGWYIDRAAVEEHAAPPARSSFVDDFEAWQTNMWIRSGWGADTNSALGGMGCMRDTPFGRIPPDTYLYLTLGVPLDLSGTVSPVMTYWMKGSLAYRTYYRAQVSTNGGVGWVDVHAQNYYWDQADWLKVQVSLSAYRRADVRVRFASWSVEGTSPATDIYIDRIGVGEQPPGAPVLASPVNFASINDRQPLLVVTNATDPQSDPLTYRFEVFSDETLSNLVAMVPSVAGQAVITAWKVDAQLVNNSQYWWRSQANDGSNAGPWMSTATFYINETNAAPTRPAIAGPPPASILETLGEILAWWPSTDPDAGDEVEAYHVQIAPDNTFTNPVVDDDTLVVGEAPEGANWAVSVALNELAGTAGLVTNSIYHWRVRALDARGGVSPWADGAFWFYFGIPPPDVVGVASASAGVFTVEVERTSRSVVVEFTPSLVEPDWQPITVPVVGTNVVFELPPGESSGFFRMVTE
jgi:hypothetical protein